MASNQECLLPGTLIRLKNKSYGVIVDVNFEFEKVWIGDNDACLYTAYIAGSYVLLIREAFDLVVY